MRLVGSMADLMVLVGLCALPSAVDLARWDQTSKGVAPSTAWRNHDGLFARFSVAP